MVDGYHASKKVLSCSIAGETLCVCMQHAVQDENGGVDTHQQRDSQEAMYAIRCEAVNYVYLRHRVP